MSAERGILFSDRLVRAILDGRKTQTRRIVKVPWKGSKKTLPYEPYYVEEDGRLLYQDEDGRYLPMEPLCPYGVPGDRLYVREAFNLKAVNVNGVDFNPQNYRATRTLRDPISGWRPSIHMPKKLSRIWLEITGVRVERVQDITAEDCIAEGVTIWNHHSAGHRDEEYRREFARLWNQTNAHRSGCTWEDNPWVWAISFRRIDHA